MPSITRHQIFASRKNVEGLSHCVIDTYKIDVYQNYIIFQDISSTFGGKKTTLKSFSKGKADVTQVNFSDGSQKNFATYKESSGEKAVVIQTKKDGKESRYTTLHGNGITNRHGYDK